MSRPFRTLGFVAVALLVATAAPVSAQRLDKLTYLTFSGPVQVPGLTLGAGTYRFQLALASPDGSLGFPLGVLPMRVGVSR